MVMMLFGTIGVRRGGCDLLRPAASAVVRSVELSRLPDRKRGQFLHQLRCRKAAAVQPLRLAAGGGAQLCVLPRVR